MRSEGVRWPLCGEPLQLTSDGFGGHRESCRRETISGVSSWCGMETRLGSGKAIRPVVSVRPFRHCVSHRERDEEKTLMGGS